LKSNPSVGICKLTSYLGDYQFSDTFPRNLFVHLWIVSV
jgi:hypothetical protein